MGNSSQWSRQRITSQLKMESQTESCHRAIGITTAQWLERELKYNQWHRSDNGQFDFARGGSSGGASVGNDALHWGSASSRGASVAQSTQHSDTRRPTPNQTGVATPRPIPTQSPAPPLTADHIRAVLPGAGSYAEVHANPINRAMARYRIETPEQQAFFLAQVSVESQNLQKVTEDLNYSASRITEVWGQGCSTLITDHCS